MIWNLIVWLILGSVSGWIASKITGNDERMGVGMNLVVGIIGAFIGGWITSLFGLGTVTGLNLWSFVISILGAVILLSIVSMFKKKT